MKNKGKKKHLPLKLLVTALAAAFICCAVYRFCNQRAILANQQERMEQLQQQQQNLEDELERINRLKLNADTLAYAEQYLREKLGMIKEGEILFTTQD